MNVVVVNDYSTVQGGTDQVALAGARAMAERGHRVLFFAPAGQEVPPILQHSLIEVETMGQSDLRGGRNKLASAVRGFWNRAAARRLAELLAPFDPADTVVHVHGWTKAVTTAVFPMLRRLGFEPVVTFHDFFVTCPNGAFFEFPANKICRRVPLSLSCLTCQCDRRSYAQKLYRVARQAVQHTMGRVPGELKHSIVISRHSEAVLKPRLPAQTARHFVPNPIEVEQAPRIAAEHNPTFVFMGRLTAEKAPHHLALAGARLRVPVRFVGEGYLREEIMRANPEAEITGWIDRTAVNRQLQSARALVFTSIWHETFGLTVGEALAQGVPVLVADACAAAELVKPGRNGHLYRSGDIDDLVEKMTRLGDPTEVRRLSEAAYADYWAAPLSLQAHATRLLDAYAAVLATQNGGTTEKPLAA